MNFVWHNIGDFKFIGRCPYMRKMPNGFYCPCGKCLYCRTRIAKDLAFRCEEEAFDKYVYNVLITYDNDHLCIRQGSDGNLHAVLNKVHFQDFMKRFREWYRKEYKSTLRYLIVGEYGGKKGRPHYHMILFTDFSLENKRLDRDDKGRICPYAYISSVITEKWRKGECDVEPMTNVGGSIVYMVQYLLSHHKDYDPRLEQPFKLMSRGKGLGYKFLERASSFIEYSKNTGDIIFNNNGRKLPVPRYYQRKYFEECQLIARADEYYYVGLEYDLYIENLTNYEKRKLTDVVTQWRSTQQRISEQRYRQAKIHDNNRSAGRVFASRAQKRKG